MSRQDRQGLTLFDLLARSWRQPVAIVGLRFSGDDATVAFACADGAVKIAAVADAEPPDARIRVSADLGQAMIRPRARPPAPLIATAALAEGAPALAGAGRGYLVGADDEVLRLDADGATTPIGLRLGGPLRAIDQAPASGAIAAGGAAGAVLARGADEQWHLAGPDVAALAFTPRGDRLAVARGDGLAIWEIAGTPRLLREVALGAGATAIGWRADGAWLACALGAQGLGLVEPASGRAATAGGFPAAVRSLGWSSPASALVAAGAFRITAWSDTLLPLDGETAGALATGRAGLVLVEAVAPHPDRRLVAAGYANGQIVVAGIGGRDEVVLRVAGGAVTALAWSRDGRHLAVGDAEGEAAIITFPPQMFK